LIAARSRKSESVRGAGGKKKQGLVARNPAWQILQARSMVKSKECRRGVYAENFICLIA
jgi:hypothetical protein